MNFMFKIKMSEREVNGRKPSKLNEMKIFVHNQMGIDK